MFFFFFIEVWIFTWKYLCFLMIWDWSCDVGKFILFRFYGILFLLFVNCLWKQFFIFSLVFVNKFWLELFVYRYLFSPPVNWIFVHFGYLIKSSSFVQLPLLGIENGFNFKAFVFHVSSHWVFSYLGVLRDFSRISNKWFP